MRAFLMIACFATVCAGAAWARDPSTSPKLGDAADGSEPSPDSNPTRAEDRFKSETRPKSDEMLATAVHESLTKDKRVNAMQIRVTANEGVVKLDGIVPRQADRDAAESIARQVAGVRHVNNALSVDAEPDSRARDVTDSRANGSLTRDTRDMAIGRGVTRRRVIQGAAMLGAAMALRPARTARAAPAPPVPRRPLGKTGEQVSALCLGGYHLGTVQSQADADRIVHEALDAGVNFMDNAWEYNDGRSEELMGKALEGRRDQAFLMTKVCTHGRGRDTAMQQLEESLRRLRTDHLDLWQVHECIYDNDPALHYAAGGVLEALDQAKRDGKTRFVGFTGHKDPSIHRAMLDGGYAFDTCQLPLNCADGTFRSFERTILPELTRRGIAPLGMKSFGGGALVANRIVTPEEALRYAMSLPVATTVSGIDSIEVLHQNLAVAAGFTPLPPADVEELRERCRRWAADGRFELYKTSKKFDGRPGREQHGFPQPGELPT